MAVVGTSIEFKENINATFNLTTMLPVENRMTFEGYILSAFFLFVIGVLGMMNNIAVFVIMAINEQLRSPINLILLNLAFSDFGICAVGTPLSFLSAINHGWYFSSITCVTYAFLMSLFGIASITSLTVLSFERYLMISRPFSGRKLSTRSSFFVILAVWIYAFIVTMPPLAGWGAFGIEGPGISCSVDWETRSLRNTSYIIYMFLFGLVFPLIVMGFSYTNIVLTLRQSGNSGLQSGVAKAEARVAVMVIAMWITFLVAWTPYSVFALIMAFGNPNHLTPEAAAVPALIAKSSCIYNPVIYVGLNTQFRSAWKRMLHCKPDAAESMAALQTEKVSLTLCSEQNSPKNYIKLPVSSRGAKEMMIPCSIASRKLQNLFSRDIKYSEEFSLQTLTSQMPPLPHHSEFDPALQPEVLHQPEEDDFHQRKSKFTWKGLPLSQSLPKLSNLSSARHLPRPKTELFSTYYFERGSFKQGHVTTIGISKKGFASTQV